MCNKFMFVRRFFAIFFPRKYSLFSFFFKNNRKNKYFFMFSFFYFYAPTSRILNGEIFVKKNIYINKKKKERE